MINRFGWALGILVFGCAGKNLETDAVSERSSALAAGPLAQQAALEDQTPATEAPAVPDAVPAPPAQLASAADAGAPAAAPAADAGLPAGYQLVLGHRVDVAWLAQFGDTESRSCQTDADCPISGWCVPALHGGFHVCAKQDPNGYLTRYSACAADDECSQLEGATVCRQAAYPVCPGVLPTHIQCCEPGADGAPCFAADPVDAEPCRYSPAADAGAP